MLTSVKELQGTTIEAIDGPIGSVNALLFDDVSWVIRYIVVDTGHWLPGRRVLISPISVARGGVGERLHVGLDRQQIRNSPDIDSDRPVSREMERTFHAYYGYGPYWGGGAIWGPALYPAALAGRRSAADGAFDHTGEERSEADPH